MTKKSEKVCYSFTYLTKSFFMRSTLESRIDVWQGINVGPGNFVKKNKRRALNKCRA